MHRLPGLRRRLPGREQCPRGWGRRITEAPIAALDRKVDALDLALFAQGFGQMGTFPGDVYPTGTADGDVDGLDLSAMSLEFGRTDCP